MKSLVPLDLRLWHRPLLRPARINCRNDLSKLDNYTEHAPPREETIRQPIPAHRDFFFEGVAVCDCVACVGVQVRQQPWQLQPAKSPLWAKLCVTLQGSLRKKAHVVSKQGFEQEAASGALG